MTVEWEVKNYKNKKFSLTDKKNNDFLLPYGRKDTICSVV
jgi:hypothetical protein